METEVKQFKTMYNQWLSGARRIDPESTEALIYKILKGVKPGQQQFIQKNFPEYFCPAHYILNGYSPTTSKLDEDEPLGHDFILTALYEAARQIEPGDSHSILSVKCAIEQLQLSREKAIYVLSDIGSDT
jgi:hypothetical protein